MNSPLDYERVKIKRQRKRFLPDVVFVWTLTALMFLTVVGALVVYWW